MAVRRKKTTLAGIAYSIRGVYHFIKFIALTSVLCIVLLVGKVLSRGIPYYLKKKKTRYIVILFILSLLAIIAAALFKMLHRPHAGTLLVAGLLGQLVCWLVILIKTIPGDQSGTNVNK